MDRNARRNERNTHIRMLNQDITDLFGRVDVGTNVVVLR
jgi:lipoprotein-anchoring transpeptidase ErfK/SrfK